MGNRSGRGFNRVKEMEGSFIINGKEVLNRNPKEIRKLGIAHVPEDRLSTGLSKEATIWENLLMGIQHDRLMQLKGFI